MQKTKKKSILVEPYYITYYKNISKREKMSINDNAQKFSSHKY